MKTRRILSLILAALIVLAALGVFLRFHAAIDHTLIDDAYITYRYAANFAQGEGLVYNTGERVLGTTTPGYALLLGMLGAVFGADAIPRISTVISVVSLLFVAGGGAYLAWRLTRWYILAALVAFVILVNYNTIYTNIAGMEVSFFLAVLLLGVLLAVDERWLPAALVIGLLPWLRPEGAFAVGLFGLHLLLLWRVDPAWTLRRVVLVGAVVVAPGLLMALILTLYYGSPLPHSVTAKRAGLYPIPPRKTTEEILDFLRSSYGLTTPDGDRFGRADETFEWYFALGRVIVALALTVGVSAFWLYRRARVLWILPVLLLMLLVFFARSGTLIFEHYFALFDVMNVLFWWLALAVLLRLVLLRLGGWFLRGENARQRLNQFGTPLVVIAALIIAFIPQYNRMPWEDLERGYIHLTQPDKRLVAYRDLAQELAPLLPEGTVIAMPEIGELGYHLDEMYVMDTAGLVTREAVPYFPVPDDLRANARTGIIPPQMMKDYQPEMIITLDTFIKEGLIEDPWLWANYESLVEIRGEWLPWFGEVIYVFVRDDFAPQLDLGAVATRFRDYAL